MLSNLVPLATIAFDRAIQGFALLFWQNPAACLVVLVSLLGLTVVALVEWAKVSSRSRRRLAQHTKPMMLRR